MHAYTVTFRGAFLPSGAFSRLWVVIGAAAFRAASDPAPTIVALVEMVLASDLSHLHSYGLYSYGHRCPRRSGPCTRPQVHSIYSVCSICSVPSTYLGCPSHLLWCLVWVPNIYSVPTLLGRPAPIRFCHRCCIGRVRPVTSRCRHWVVLAVAVAAWAWV